jgi:hypothetical protein
MLLNLTEKQFMILSNLIDKKNQLDQEIVMINLRQKEIAELILDFNNINISDVAEMNFIDKKLNVVLITKEITTPILE